MKETCEKIKEYFKENKTMSTTQFWLSIAVALLSGIVLGMLFSPKKQKTTYIGCNNGNNSGNYGSDSDEDDDCDCCEDCCVDNWDEAYEEAEVVDEDSEKEYIKIQ